MSRRTPSNVFRFLAAAATVFGAMLILSFAGTTSAKPPGGNGGGGGSDGGSTGSTLSYVIYQLDSHGGAFSGFAANLNDAGAVVGQAIDVADNELFAAYWDVTVGTDGTVTTHLNLLPESNNAYATGVNNHGTVIGNGAAGTGLCWPSATLDPLPLPPLSGDTISLTRRINDAGIVCGLSILEVAGPNGAIQEEHPVVWRVASDDQGNPVVAGPYALPSVNGSAEDLSEPDAEGVVTVVGNAWDNAGSAAVAWHVAPLTDGGILIDPQLEVIQVGANAYGVNGAGVASGDSSRPDWIATLWTASDAFRLALPRKFASSSAIDLNDTGVVVGWVGEDGSGFSRKPAVWNGPNASPVLLSSFLNRKSPFDDLTDAPAINQAGVIVGAGWDNGTEQAFIALPW